MIRATVTFELRTDVAAADIEETLRSVVEHCTAREAIEGGLEGADIDATVEGFTLRSVADVPACPECLDGTVVCNTCDECDETHCSRCDPCDGSWRCDAIDNRHDGKECGAINDAGDGCCRSCGACPEARS